MKQKIAHLGMIETTRVVRDAQPITFGQDGICSLGALLDSHIVAELEAGHELQSVQLHFAEESRERLADFYGVK